MENNLSQQIYGLIGYPVKHSLSPVMHNAAFRQLNINAEYRLFEVKPEALFSFLNNLPADVSGFNITIPHKITAKQIIEKKFPLKNEEALMPESLYQIKLSGAINTVKVNRDNQGKINNLEQYNTDSYGFLKSLRDDLGFNPEGASVFLVGCGGAGRAVIAGLSWKNIKVKKIYVYDIYEQAVEYLKQHFQTLPGGWQSDLQKKIEFICAEEITDTLKKCQLLVNASGLGMKENDPSVVKEELLHKDLFVYDLVYNKNTQLIRKAKKRNLSACNGAGMLLHQGAAAFENWTGQKAPLEIMKDALKKEMVSICF